MHATQLNLNTILEPVADELKALEDKLSNINSNNDILGQITSYIISLKGKRLRPAMVFLFSKLLNKARVDFNCFQIAYALELVHTATLIHDDVVDEADIRRGKATVNKLWSDKQAVIAGDFLLANAMCSLSSTKSTDVIDIFSETLKEVCIGEIQQISSKNQLISIEEYILKCQRKTAMLFLAGVKSLGSVIEGISTDEIKACTDFALNFGICFQIVDDILNFQSEIQTGKNFISDIENGIYTAPLLFALQNDKNSEIIEILGSENLSDAQTDKIINFINKNNGIVQSSQLAKTYSGKAIQSLSIFEKNEYKQALINLLEYVLSRC